ncbi:MAG: hypothetical protein H0W25_16860, partial [Acidimicrobiia bacterium]|nr:hypothetical protein [Acidimicrobiia bacterium]
MRQLLPEPRDDVDPVAVYGADLRTAPEPGRRPWVLVNMIATVDGRATIAGRTTPCGARGRRHGRRRNRPGEGYGPMDQRAVVVSRSVDLSPSSGLLAAVDKTVVVITPSPDRELERAPPECTASTFSSPVGDLDYPISIVTTY